MPTELPAPHQEEVAQEKHVEVEGWEGARFVPCGFIASKKAEGVCACCGGCCEAQVGL